MKLRFPRLVGVDRVIAFAMPNSSSTLSWDSGGESVLQRLVNAKNSSGKSTKIVLSVGEQTNTTNDVNSTPSRGLGWEPMVQSSLL